MTDYTYKLTVCATADQLSDANQLALIVGESFRDDETFGDLNYERDGQKYSCVSTPVKPVVNAAYEADVLPPTPDHAEGADRFTASGYGYGCDVGVESAEIALSDVSPMAQADDRSPWLRVGRLEFNLVQRVGFQEIRRQWKQEN